MNALALQVAGSARTRHESFPDLVCKLNEVSVRKYYQAYKDVAWDAEESRIDRRDPRFCLAPEHPLGGSDWYLALPADTRAQLGLELMCQGAKFGTSFESVLSRGLLEFSRTIDNRSPLYRYALHEVIEESQHSLMFQEFINRSGCDPHDVSRLTRWLDRFVVASGSMFPELFFFFVLGGEIFFDHDNRVMLERRDQLHPLLARILQIHVTEEARHVCFAQRYLQAHLPRLGSTKRRVLQLAVPHILRGAAEMTVYPAARIVRSYGIPRRVLDRAYAADAPFRAGLREVARPVLALLDTPADHTPHSPRLRSTSLTV